MRKYNTLAGILPCLRDILTDAESSSGEFIRGGELRRRLSRIQQSKFVTGRAKAKYFLSHKATPDLCRNT